MINAIVGRPRSGKSYEAVMFHILPAAKEGRLVITNIPIFLDKVAVYYGEDAAKNITCVSAAFNEYGMIRPFSVPEDFTKYEWRNDKGQGPLFVVDEAHLSLGTDAKRPVLEYLSLHGHYGHDIILLTQSPRKLHRDVKDMVEVCWRCVKKSIFGDDSEYIKKTYHGVPQRNDGFVHEEERQYQSQYFQFYKSHTQSQGSVDEATAKDIKANIFPRKKLSIGLMVIGSLFAVFFGMQMFSAPTKSQQPADASSKPAASLPSASSQSFEPSIYPERVRPYPDSRQPESDPVRSKTPKISGHPFNKVQLHVDGWGKYFTGKYLVKDYYFAASQNGQLVFTLTLSDLKLAGYDVTVYGDCAVRISYDDYTEWLTCDSPQVTTGVPVSVGDTDASS